MVPFIKDKVVILTMALKEESQGLFEKANIPVLWTGMGLISASISLTECLTKLLADKDPKDIVVLNLGTAGSRKIQPGQLVECTSFVQRGAPLKLLAPKISVVSGQRISQLPEVICGSSDQVDLGDTKNNEDFDIMDMEAYALAQVCARMKVSFSSVKYITDSSGKNVYQEWKKALPKAAEALFDFYKEFSK